MLRNLFQEYLAGEDQMVFDFDENETIGTVVAVDSARVTIMVTNIGIVPRLGIGNLTSIKAVPRLSNLSALLNALLAASSNRQPKGNPTTRTYLSLLPRVI
jgi:hypothetical protein